MAEPVDNPLPRRRAIVMIVAGGVLLAASIAVAIILVSGGLGTLLDGEPDPIVGGQRTVTTTEPDQTFALYYTLADPAGCEVDGPDGEVAIRPLEATETLTFNNRSYLARDEFTAEVPGGYVVTCPTSGVAVGPRVGVISLIGGIFGLLGIASLLVPGSGLLIFFGIRRLRARPQGSFLDQAQPQGPFPVQER